MAVRQNAGLHFIEHRLQGAVTTAIRLSSNITISLLEFGQASNEDHPLLARVGVDGVLREYNSQVLLLLKPQIMSLRGDPFAHHNNGESDVFQCGTPITGVILKKLRHTTRGRDCLRLDQVRDEATLS